MRDDSRQAMKLFANLVKRAHQSSFTRHVQGSDGIYVEYSYGDDPKDIMNASHNGPQLEAIEHAAIIFRQFVQKDDITSLRKMARILDDPDVSERWKDEFAKHRAELNHLFDSPTAFPIGGKYLKRRYIYDTLINGGSAHSDPDKVKVIEQWQSAPDTYTVIEGKFIMTMAETFKALKYIADLCEEELSREATQASGK